MAGVWLADVVLGVHLLFILFVTGGLLVIAAGARYRWGFVRNRRFRLLHLAAIVYVALEAVIGLNCPLTVLEDRLRGRQTGSGLIARFVHQVIFWDLPGWAFTLLYVLFAALVAWTYWRVPPAPHRASARPPASGMPPPEWP